MTSFRRSSLFYRCLAISLGVHAAALWVFYTQPVFLQPLLTTILGKSSPDVAIPLSEEDINLSEKNIALEKAFNQIIVTCPNLQRPIDFLSGDTIGNAYRPFAEQAEIPISSEAAALLPKSPAAEEKTTLATPAFSEPSLVIPGVESLEPKISPILPRIAYEGESDMEFIRELQRKVASAIGEPSSEELFAGLEIHYPPQREKAGVLRPPKQLRPLRIPSLSQESELIALVSPQEQASLPPAFSYEPTLSPFVTRIEAPKKTAAPSRAASSSPAQLPSLAFYALPEGKAASDWNDDFNISLKTTEREDGKYLFSITISPKRDLKEREMRQNFYFLIDRSNSIEKHRYQSFKRAVSKAIHSLKEGDYFNIIVFDSKVARLSEKPLPFTKKNLQLAEGFIERQEHGSYFAAADIYHSLPKIIPDEVPLGEVNTAILISDGGSSSASEKQCKLIRSWLEKNDGKVTLYAAAAGQDNNLAALDLISTFSRGHLLYSDTHSGFARKLAKLVIDLHHPIAKNLSATVLKADASTHVQIFPRSAHLPHLFSGRSYTIYGIADKPADFILLLQGENKSEALAIQKKISFEEQKGGSKLLEKEWDKVQAHLFYEDYLKEAKPVFLEKAEALLFHESPRRRR